MQLYRYSADNDLQQIIYKVLDTKTDSVLVSWIQENEGDKEYNVEEPILIRFIYHTLLHKKAKEVLCDVVNLLSNKSITRTVFHMLLYYPDESIRTDVLVILAHMNLTLYQLRVLCETEVTFECFYTLGEKLYLDEKVPVNKFEGFIEFFSHSKFKDHLIVFQNNFVKQGFSKEKDIIIEKYTAKLKP